MDIGTLRGIITLVLLLAFIGIVIWAYSAKRKSAFDEAAQLPLADEPGDRTQASASGDAPSTDTTNHGHRGPSDRTGA